MARDTRDRMVATAALLLREHGAAGVTIDAVLARGGAPRGSVYHHFPGGRVELLEAAVAYAGAYIAERIDQARESRDPVETVTAYCEQWRDQLVESDFRAGCPVVAVAVEADERLAGAVGLAAEAFGAWRRVLVDALLAADVDPERAERLANTVLAALEGAIVICRAERSIVALDAVTAELADLVAAALPGD